MIGERVLNETSSSSCRESVVGAAVGSASALLLLAGAGILIVCYLRHNRRHQISDTLRLTGFTLMLTHTNILQRGMPCFIHKLLY